MITPVLTGTSGFNCGGVGILFESFVLPTSCVMDLKVTIIDPSEKNSVPRLQFD